jgi:hypothetical protein
MSLSLQQLLCFEAELEKERRDGWFFSNPRFEELGDLFFHFAVRCKPVNIDILWKAKRAYEQCFQTEKLYYVNVLLMKFSDDYYK